MFWQKMTDKMADLLLEKALYTRKEGEHRTVMASVVTEVPRERGAGRVTTAEVFSVAEGDDIIPGGMEDIDRCAGRPLRTD